jgi:ATP-dependent RNA helicase DDX5/DBP2
MTTDFSNRKLAKRRAKKHRAAAANEEAENRDDRRKRIRVKRGPNYRIRRGACFKPPPLPPGLAAEDAAKEAAERAAKADALSRRQRKRLRLAVQQEEAVDEDDISGSELDDEAEGAGDEDGEDKQPPQRLPARKGLPAPPLSDVDTAAAPPPGEFTTALARLGYAAPTRVQSLVWAAALQGRDVLALDAPGSGKTFAYLFPVLMHALGRGGDVTAARFVAKARRGGNDDVVVCPLALAILPARELVLQVLGESRKARTALKCGGQVSCQAVHGGVPLEMHVDALSQQPPCVLVGTPGRCRALLEAGILSLQHCSMLVLDEADKIIGDPACGADTAVLRDALAPIKGKKHQTMLVSATMPPALGASQKGLAQWLIDAVRIEGASKKGKGAPVSQELPPTATALPGSGREVGGTPGAAVTQEVLVCAEHKKPRKLLRHLEQLREQEKATNARSRARVLIFTNTIKTGRFVVDLLQRHNHQCALLHGGSMPQERRQQLLTHFRAGKLPMLVATDVAARGLHITGLERVVLWDFPSTLEQYTHRVGRAGRAGCPGYALSFITRAYARLAPSLVSALRAGGHAVDMHLEQLAQLVTEHLGAAAEAGAEEAGPQEEEGEQEEPVRMQRKRVANGAAAATRRDDHAAAAEPMRRAKRAKAAPAGEWDDTTLIARAPLF